MRSLKKVDNTEYPKSGNKNFNAGGEGGGGVSVLQNQNF